MNRRAFVARLAGSALAPAVVTLLARRVHAQAIQTPGAVDTSNLFAMDQSASRPVRLPPKPGSRVVVSADERDALEHRIRCQCGCTLDVYTCRTTDFSCQVSPSMHRDIMSLVSGGYSAQEIIDAFVGVYGERVLMAPRASGFNLLGWIAPFAVLGGGAVLVAALLRSWRRAPRPISVATTTSSVDRRTDGTDDELARLDAAVRDDR
jgi:cytochrome c-type biogenesis protein CcmH